MRGTAAIQAGIPFVVRDSPEAQPGDPCPRVELDPSVAEPARLFGVMVHSDLRRAWPQFWRKETRHMDEDAKDEVLDLLQAAFSDSAIAAVLHPPVSMPDMEEATE